MQIEVTYYNWKGELIERVIYPNSGAAFAALVERNQDALAYPVGTTCGGYEWRSRQEGHTLNGFNSKMAMCCNDPGEYSERLIQAGICNRHR